MKSILIGKFKCDFGAKQVCSSSSLYVGVNYINRGLYNFPDYEIVITLDRTKRFLDKKFNMQQSAAGRAYSKSEICFEDLDIYDEDGFHIYNAKNVWVQSKDEGNLITYTLKADWIQGWCNPKCRYWQKVEESLPVPQDNLNIVGL